MVYDRFGMLNLVHCDPFGLGAPMYASRTISTCSRINAFVWPIFQSTPVGSYFWKTAAHKSFSEPSFGNPAVSTRNRKRKSGNSRRTGSPNTVYLTTVKDHCHHHCRCFVIDTVCALVRVNCHRPLSLILALILSLKLFGLGVVQHCMQPSFEKEAKP